MKKSINHSLIFLSILLLSSCGNSNNARLAIGGDSLTLDQYREYVAPSYEEMAGNDHFSLSANGASFKIKGDFEIVLANGTANQYSIDIDIASFSYTSAFVYASDRSGVSPKGALSISFLNADDVQSGSSTPLLTSESHLVKAKWEDGAVTSSTGYEAYSSLFSTTILPHLPSFSPIYPNLLFSSLPSSGPIISEDVLLEAHDTLVEMAESFKNLEKKIAFNDELLTVNSFGDGVYGIGLYMDRADYLNFLSSYKNSYTSLDEYMGYYGNFYENVAMDKLAISQINNADGIVNFGINLDCTLPSMEDEAGNPLYISVPTSSSATNASNAHYSFRVSNLDIDIEAVFSLTQGTEALNIYNAIAE